MAAQAKDYKLVDAYVVHNDTKYDIKALIAEFTWMETIDSPFVRCDMTLLDSIQFGDVLFGDEMVKLCFETYASIDPEQRNSRNAKKTRIDADLQIYKIGSIIKNERAKVYILHCASPEVYLNEANRTFGGFGPHAQKPDTVQYVIAHKLKAPQKIKHKGAIEPHSNINFISPNWRPVDCISYVTDKVVRSQSKGGKGGKTTTQSGFLFYENRLGFNFQSIDYLCEQESLETYTYTPGGSAEASSGDNSYRIESITYPERMNHLDKMRSGLYKNITMGIVIPAISESAIPNPAATSSAVFDRLYESGTVPAGSSVPEYANSLSGEEFTKYLDSGKSTTNFFSAGGESGRSFSMESFTYAMNFKNTSKQIQTAENQSKAGGTSQPPTVFSLGQVFTQASTLEKAPPFDKEKIKQYSQDHPTRMKVRILPKYTQQTAGQPNNGADNQPQDVLVTGAYAAARLALINTLTLTIKVPGNSRLYAGGVIKTVIPESGTERNSDNVKLDKKYSGRYLIKGLKHTYKKTGISTELHLCRDSVPST